ncbi:MAG TPA: MFS transporter [Candidatus Dormibacteraeota bacterium]|nr:MFS transporter [Candidatus Dormibacteraeota bacterium]
MVTVQGIMSLAFSISTPFLPLFIGDLGVHSIASVDLWSGIISSANFIFAAIVSPMWGAVSDRIGRKAMVIRSSVAVCIFTALMGLSQNVWQLFGARAAMGLFSGFAAAAIALVGTQVPEERLGFALGWLATGQLLGGLIGPMAGGLLADVLHGYREVFFWTSAFAAVASLVVVAFVHDGFDRHAAHQRTGPPFRERLRALMRDGGILPMLVVILMVQFAAFGIQPVVSIYVQQMVGNVPWLATAAGAAFSITGLSDVIASPFLGKRSDQLGYRRVLLISLAGAAVFTIAQAFTHDIWTFLAARFGIGVFLGGILPTANALIGRLTPAADRGRVYGVTSSAMFIGMFIGPLAGGIISAKFGIPAMFVVAGVCLVANALWVLWRVEDTTRGDPQTLGASGT